MCENFLKSLLIQTQLLTYTSQVTFGLFVGLLIGIFVAGVSEDPDSD